MLKFMEMYERSLNIKPGSSYLAYSRKKSFGYLKFDIHICTAMKLQFVYKHWWWHTSS